MVTINEIAKVLGEPPSIVGCATSAAINPHSLLKPTSTNLATTSNVAEITSADCGGGEGLYLGYGLFAPVVTSVADLRTLRDKRWQHNKPTATSLKHLAHFDGYDHKAKAKASVLDVDYKIGLNTRISLDLTASATSVDAKNISKLGEYYPSVAMFENGSLKWVAVSDKPLKNVNAPIWWEIYNERLTAPSVVEFVPFLGGNYQLYEESYAPVSDWGEESAQNVSEAAPSLYLVSLNTFADMSYMLEFASVYAVVSGEVIVVDGVRKAKITIKVTNNTHKVGLDEPNSMWDVNGTISYLNYTKGFSIPLPAMASTGETLTYEGVYDLAGASGNEVSFAIEGTAKVDFPQRDIAFSQQYILQI